MDAAHREKWIIDVGAFDGREGLRLREHLGGRYPLLCIEPDPENFGRIPDGLPGLKLNLAVAPHDGEIGFNFYKPETGSVLEINERVLCHYIDGHTGKPASAADWKLRKRQSVPCRRLDSLCREHGIGRVRFLKIDTQGFDLEVLKSFGDDLSIVEELVCEVQLEEHRIYRNSATKEALIEYLHSKGFLFIRQLFQSFDQELNMYFRRGDLFGCLKREPLVSILTPSYRSGRFIERCIESVLRQDYPWAEHIVQDGGSRDGTVDVLRRYAGKIDWVSEPDGGQSDGLNKAFQRCRGDIIGVLNADDEYLPQAVSWAVENLLRFPEAAVIYGQQNNIDEAGRCIDTSRGPAPYRFGRIFCCDDVIPAQAAFIRKTALEKVGFYADVTRDTCPDYEMFVRLGLRHPMRYVPGVVANYRFHGGSEGQQEEVIHRMVRSKRFVIDRICDDPKTPWRIRRLRRKAHAGVLNWSACHFLPPMISHCETKALGQWRKSFSVYPRFDVFLRLFLYELSRLVQFLGKTRFRFSVDPAGPIRSAYYTLDPMEKFRVFIRVVRESGRKLDRILLGGIVYKYIYLPIKYKVKGAP